LLIKSIGPLVSSILLFTLTVITITSGRKNRIWKVFSLYTFMLSLVSFFVFLIFNGLPNNEQIFIKILPALPFLTFYSLYFAVYYAYLLIDENDQFKIGNFQISISKYSSIGIILWTGFIFFIIQSDYFARDIQFDIMKQQFQVHLGPLYYFLIFIYLGAIGKIIFFLIKAYRGTNSKIKKNFVKLNIVGFLFMYLPAVIIMTILPNFGIENRTYNFTLIPGAVIIFYIAIFRYQFAQVEDLNVNLEKKVEEKTEELKQTQLRAYQAEKMAAMGNLTAGIFHELNNPIGALKSSADLIKRLVPHFEKEIQNETFSSKMTLLKENSENIIISSNRVHSLLNELKLFSQLDNAEYQNYDIHQGINSSLHLLGFKLNHVKVIKEFGTVKPVWCSPYQVNQIFSNVMLNSIEALKDIQGEIKIITDSQKDYARIQIIDTGKGIKKEYLNKIFDPGFTTKGSGVGTGLGLSIVYNMIQHHKGKIEVISPFYCDCIPPKGTQVIIFLPYTFQN